MRDDLGMRDISFVIINLKYKLIFLFIAIFQLNGLILVVEGQTLNFDILSFELS